MADYKHTQHSISTYPITIFHVKYGAPVQLCLCHCQLALTYHNMSSSAIQHCHWNLEPMEIFTPLLPKYNYILIMIMEQQRVSNADNKSIQLLPQNGLIAWVGCVALSATACVHALFLVTFFYNMVQAYLFHTTQRKHLYKIGIPRVLISTLHLNMGPWVLENCLVSIIFAYRSS